MNKVAIGCGGLVVVLLFVGLIIGLFFWGTYNRLVTLDQEVNKKWGDVQTVYQRRADLIPNLVNTVAGAANFEKSTLTEVTNARASVGRVQLDPNKAPTDAAQLQQFQQAQGQLGNALSRLLVVSERYPELRAKLAQTIFETVGRGDPANRADVSVAQSLEPPSCRLEHRTAR